MKKNNAGKARIILHKLNNRGRPLLNLNLIYSHFSAIIILESEVDSMLWIYPCLVIIWLIFGALGIFSSNKKWIFIFAFSTIILVIVSKPLGY